MSEQQEKVHVVMRYTVLGVLNRTIAAKPVGVFDDRAEARAYAKRLDDRSSRYSYDVVTTLRK